MPYLVLSCVFMSCGVLASRRGPKKRKEEERQEEKRRDGVFGQKKRKEGDEAPPLSANSYFPTWGRYLAFSLLLAYVLVLSCLVCALSCVVLFMACVVL